VNSQRALVIALVISVAINVLFVGVVIGRIMSGPPHPGRGAEDLGWMWRRLDAGQRAELRPRFEQLRRDVAPLRRELRTAQQGLYRVLASDASTDEQLDGAFARVGEAQARLQRAMQEHMAATLKSLPPADRKEIAGFLTGRHGRPRLPPPGGPTPAEP